MKKFFVMLLFFAVHVASYAGSIQVVNNGVPESNDKMGNAVAFMETGNTWTSGFVVGVKGEDGMGAIMYYSYDDTDPVYIKYQGNPGDAFGHAITVGYFNDDGYMDIAVGVPWADYSYYINAGEVYIFYGSASGPNWWDPQIIRDSTTRQIGAGFGFSLASENVIDNRGRDELIVGIPYYDYNDATDAGAIKVYSKVYTALPVAGFSWAGKLITQATSGIAGSPEAYDRFGWSVAADFDSNNIAIGVPYEAIDEHANAGMVHVIKMGTGGDIVDSTHFHQNHPSSMGGAPEPNDRFGYAIDIDRYGLMIGVPGEDVTVDGVNRTDAGIVQTVGIDPNSLSATSFNIYHQGDGIFSGTPEAGDDFGFAVSLEWDGAGCSYAPAGCGTVKHMVVGVPGENNDAGMVQVSTSSTVNVHQNNIESDGRETGDRFGEAIAASISGLDLLVGAPGENVNSTSNAGVAHFVEFSWGSISNSRLLIQN